MTIRIAPVPGESFESWAQRNAEAFDTTRLLFLNHIGIVSSVGLDVAMPPSVRELLTSSLGLDDEVLTSMTMERYENRVLVLEPGREQVANHTMWANAAHTRVCPDCLAETGVWQLQWRLTWVFACLVHSRLLIDTCHGCQERITATPELPSRKRASWQCWMKNKWTDQLCDFDFRESEAEPLPTDHPILRAQSFMLAHIEGDESDSKVQELIEDIRSIASGLLHEKAYGRIAEIAGLDATLVHSLVPLPPETKDDDKDSEEDSEAAAKSRVGGVPPSDGLMIGALCAYAVHVLDDLGMPERSNLLVPVVEYARAFGSERTPSAVIRYLKVSSQRLIHEVRRDMTDLGAPDRLKFRTMLPTPRPLNTMTQVRHRASLLPQLMQPAWAIALDSRHSGHAEAYRSALASAVLLPGSPIRGVAHLHPLMGRDAALPMRKKYFDDRTARTESILESICSYADFLDEYGGLINFKRRRAQNWELLITSAEWAQILDSNSGCLEPDMLPAARLYLWQRITGNLSHLAPASIRFGGDKAAYEAFLHALSSEGQESLDMLASAALRQRGIEDEPVTWAPPAPTIAGALNGSELDAAVSELQEMAVWGERTFTMAGRTGLTEMAAELILDLNRPSGESLADGMAARWHDKAARNRDYAKRRYTGAEPRSSQRRARSA